MHVRHSGEIVYRAGSDRIYRPTPAPEHRNDEYDPAGFELLLNMQEQHFWYRGRHRFLWHSVRKWAQALQFRFGKLDAIDLGGGCGGWIRYLNQRATGWFDEIALGDSSLDALELARPVVGADVQRYQVDLLRLGWQERWHLVFMLDVLEHISEDVEALRQVAASLRPAGFLFVTVPALRQFWSYNDELGHHVRRYHRHDFVALAEKCGLRLCDARYFMFFLSPIYYLSRLRRPPLARMNAAERQSFLGTTHHVPSAPWNQLLSVVAGAETPIGHFVSFPWGTSLLGVFQKAQ
ncbi:hypothetical protein AYO40_05015 [Planctomycetaceae bacterium SCGC AG-212-D15]|nr:hypothetical protein AYO40_05015 [Planctomycetaceae bacterium SCGC AG-212-D15]